MLYIQRHFHANCCTRNPAKSPERLGDIPKIVPRLISDTTFYAFLAIYQEVFELYASIPFQYNRLIFQLFSF